MNASDIINWVQQIKDNWKTNDPYAIAAHLGIQVIFSDALGKDFTAYTVGFTNCPTMITINNNYSELSKRILCAHELGHALLHSDISINHFAVNSSNINTSVEREANLFAIALLANEETLSQLALPLENMNNYLLKSIIEHNLSRCS